MKFKPGDVVRYIDASDLCTEFSAAFGAGPYIVEGLADGGPKLHCLTMDGNSMKAPWGGTWRHDPDNLRLDIFLDASLKANTKKETNAKSKTRTK